MSVAALIMGVYRSANAVLAYTNGQEVVPSVDDHGNLRVSVTGSTDRSATGTLTAAQGNTATAATSAVEVNSQGSGTVGISINGTFNETILFEGSVDGTNFISVEAVTPVGGANVTSVVNNGAYAAAFTVPSAGYALIRVRCSVFTSGTATIVLEASSAGQDVNLANPIPTGNNVIGQVVGAYTPVVGETTPTNAIKTAAHLQTYNGTTWDLLRSMATGALASTTTGIINVLGVSKYNSTKPSLLDTQLTEFQGTSRGALLVAQDEIPQAQDDTNQIMATMLRPLAVSTYCWSTWVSTALEASKIVKATPGNLRSATVRLDSTAPTATYYVQFLNSATLPADGAVTHLVTPIKLVHTLGVDQSFSIDLTDCCINASAGIVVVLSTTEFTKTISGAYLSNTILYK